MCNAISHKCHQFIQFPCGIVKRSPTYACTKMVWQIQVCKIVALSKQINACGKIYSIISIA